MRQRTTRYFIWKEYSSPARRGAFTLVEILIALAIMMLLLAIVLVPINMGLDLFHIGKARSEVQQANILVVNQLANELRRAVHVFPNEQMPGITDKAPYSTSIPYYSHPYARLAGVYDLSAGAGICGTTSPFTTPIGENNTARLDILLPLSSNGVPVTPIRSELYVVSYYARRLDVTKSFDADSNPVVLFRAQYKYRNTSGTDYAAPSPAGALNANLANSRYPTPFFAPYCNNATNRAIANRGSLWITHSEWDEPNLQTPANDSGNDGSHTLITPRDMALVSPDADLTVTAPTNAAASLKPDSSFVCDDKDRDGKIDRVTISILLAKYDAIGAQDERQQIRTTRTIDLPNVK